MCIPPAGRSSPTQSALNITQKQLTMFETMIFFVWQRYCIMTRGGKKLRRLCWVRSTPSLSRDTGAAFPYSLPGMRSRTAAFFNYLSPSQIAFLSLMTEGYYARMYLLRVHWRDDKQAVQTRYRGRIIFLGRACCSSSSLCICRGLSGLSALSAVLSVCLSVWLAG